ncbi:hypothetical protein AQUCO_08200005v1 [Aquilegia coerulea]|uniref:Mei2-like C-terminal RNA recognition motif domain-containing protein n=1 Tax=Aquilegia coerulea TaxID=218851 RepID=A0A2G5C7B9_AQUCA|nr:hypothetical protein AQUCO_08200005v1 [Aquilegia coerulea]
MSLNPRAPYRQFSNMSNPPAPPSSPYLIHSSTYDPPPPPPPPSPSQPQPVIWFYPIGPLCYNPRCHLTCTPLLLPTLPNNPLDLQNNTQPKPIITENVNGMVMKEGFHTPSINIPSPKTNYKGYQKNQAFEPSCHRNNNNKLMTCKSVWRPKGSQLDGEVQGLPVADCYDFNKYEGITTVMVKNIPNELSKKMLLEVLDNHCVKENTKLRKQDDQSSYDFVYLPIDFKRELNYGFGFVNFTNASAAVRFYNSFDKLKWENVGFPCSHKICEIKKAKYQGKEELVNHCKGSVFKCQTKEYLPTVFTPPRNGANSASSTACVVGRRI